MVAKVKKLEAESHLLIHKMHHSAFVDKPYPSGDPDTDRALELVQKYGKYLLVGRVDIEPEKN